MQIDIQTAALLTIIVSLFQFAITLLYAVIVKSYRGIFHLALWNLFAALGVLLWLSIGFFPSWVAVIFGNTLQIFAGCFLYTGASLLVRNQRISSLIFVLPVLTALLLTYFTMFHDSIVFRTGVGSLAGCILTWGVALMIFRSPLRPLPLSYKFTIGVFTSYGLLFLLRIALLPFLPAPQTPYAPTFVQLLFFLLAPSFSLLIMVGFGLMITQRLLSELRETATALEHEHSRMKIMLESLAAGVIACDNEGRFTVINEVARNFHEWTEVSLHNNLVFEAFPIYLSNGKTVLKKEERPLYRALQGEDVRNFECVLISKQEQMRHFLVNASPLLTHTGQRWGGIAIFTDVTEQKLTTEAQAALLAELQQAMKEIKALRGLLPMCAHCKNIRDDAGFWQQVEDYLQQRSDVQFSHSICPDCFEKHFGQYKKSPA